MTIDITKIRPGDRVTLVPLEVKSVAPVAGVMAVFMASGGELYVSTKDIATHHPAPREFQVGDRVQAFGSADLGTVRGVDGPDVWVKWDRVGVDWGPIFRAAALTLVEGGE